MDGNTTGEKEHILRGESIPHQAAIGLMFFLSVTDITNIIGNTLVLAIVFGNSRLQTHTNMFITNLCFVDLLSGVVLIPFVMNAMASKETRTGILCDFVAFVDGLYSTATSLTIAAIAIDRYHSIVNCLYYETIVTHRRTILAIAWIWIQTLIISVCPILGWGSYSFDPFQFKCSLDLPDNHGFLYFATGTSVVVPYMMVVFCYTQIHLVARRHARSMVAIHIHDTGKRIKAVSSRKTRLVYLVVGLYSICWLPYYSIKLLKSINPSLAIPASVTTLATALSLVNGSCNPLLYALITSQYKAGMHRLYRRLKRRVGRTIVSPSVDPSKSSWSFSRPISSLYRFLQEQQETGNIPLKCLSPVNPESTINRYVGGIEGSRSSLRLSNATTDKHEKQVLLKPTACIQTLQIPERRSRIKLEADASPVAQRKSCMNGWVIGIEVQTHEDSPEIQDDYKEPKGSLPEIEFDLENHLTGTRHVIKDDRTRKNGKFHRDSDCEIRVDKLGMEREEDNVCDGDVSDDTDKMPTDDNYDLNDGTQGGGILICVTNGFNCDVGKVLINNDETTTGNGNAEETDADAIAPDRTDIHTKLKQHSDDKEIQKHHQERTNGDDRVLQGHQGPVDQERERIYKRRKNYRSEGSPSCESSSSTGRNNKANHEKDKEHIFVDDYYDIVEKERTSDEETFGNDLELETGDGENEGYSSEGIVGLLGEDDGLGTIAVKKKRKKRRKRPTRRSTSYTSEDMKGDEAVSLTRDIDEQINDPSLSMGENRSHENEAEKHEEVDHDDENAQTEQPLLKTTN